MVCHTAVPGLWLTEAWVPVPLRHPGKVFPLVIKSLSLPSDRPGFGFSLSFILYDTDQFLNLRVDLLICAQGQKAAGTSWEWEIRPLKDTGDHFEIG
jgi:hypothetical protein